MKIAIIGYGVMGRIVERLAQEKGHEIVARIDEESDGLGASGLADRLSESESAIDFSIAGAVRRNAEACALAGVPLVEGTTGWLDDLRDVVRVVGDHEGTLVYGANFSIGVNLYFRILDYAAQLFSEFPEYEAFIEEQHHSRKVDAPSGTALKMLDVVKKHYESDPSMSSTRAGNIPGTHVLGFDGIADQVVLKHSARTREGFASGSIAAAEWSVNKTGVFEFTEVVDEILGIER